MSAGAGAGTGTGTGAGAGAGTGEVIGTGTVTGAQQPPRPIERHKVETPTVFEGSRPGRRAVTVPESDVPIGASRPLDELIPRKLRRRDDARLPELGELAVVRHFTRLSQKNFSIDGQFYPLGSCTMKYNPRANEKVAALPGFGDVHPLADDADIQGALEVFWRLGEMLKALTGLDAVTLQPAAGAHGELAGLLMVRAYHKDRGEGERRRRVLIPDSAHGTNPASATLAGLDSLPVRTGPDGTVDLADLERRLAAGPAESDVACMMITNPNTLGLFEKGIERIAARLHEVGALLYLDGANLNAMLGVVRPGDFGVDVMHVNMHKTLSTPHGGGGPGSGPVLVRSILEPFLPVPRIVREEGQGTGTGAGAGSGAGAGAGARYRLASDAPLSIGRVKAFHGHGGMVWRAYAYLRAHSLEDLRGGARNAVLNANYVLARLKDAYDLPYEGPCMHEVVLSARRQKRQGVKRGALDIAKRLLDYGYHPPTIYFPLIVEEALMIEPTETEASETLDRFCEAMLAIAREAAERPEVLAQSPSTLPVRRLDEVSAARNPVVRWHGPELVVGAESITAIPPGAGRPTA